MPHITRVILGYNAFEGPIPDEWWSARQLYSIDIGNNQGISGTLSTEVGNLRDLKFLRLGDNILSGSIPSEIGLLDNLISLGKSKLLLLVVLVLMLHF